MAVLNKNEFDTQMIKVLGAVRKRPGMFISPITLNSLNNFISGFTSSNLFKDAEQDFLSRYVPSFYDWIAEKEGERCSPSYSWVDVLNEKYSDEKDAFDKFFQYLDEYLESMESDKN